MLLKRFITVAVCLTALVCMTPQSRADDPSYTSGTIDTPGDTVTAGAQIRISGSFTKSFLGPYSD